MENFANCLEMHQGEHLRALLADKKQKVVDLARYLHISRNQIYAYFKMETLHFSTLQKVAEFLQVPVSEFVPSARETDEQSGRHTTGNVGSVLPSLAEFYIQVPFLSARAQAGIPTMTFDNCDLKLAETYPVFMPDGLNKRHLIIELVGDSMEPGILSGALVLAESVKKEDIKYESGGVYAVMYANRFVVKRVKTNEINQNGTLTLWSDNDRYGHITIHSEDIDCMWKVVEKVKETVR